MSVPRKGVGGGVGAVYLNFFRDRSPMQTARRPPGEWQRSLGVSAYISSSLFHGRFSLFRSAESSVFLLFHIFFFLFFLFLETSKRQMAAIKEKRKKNLALSLSLVCVPYVSVNSDSAPRLHTQFLNEIYKHAVPAALRHVGSFPR